MALKLRLDPRAKRDLVEIRTYLLDHAGPAAANRVREHLRVRFHRLRGNPMIGVVTAEPGIRLLAPTRYPCRIYYTATARELVILHVRHSARRDPDLGDLGH
jgi:plasmid stabilization system protein ParE